MADNPRHKWWHRTRFLDQDGKHLRYCDRCQRLVGLVVESAEGTRHV